jgi:hypothetical protein
MLFYAFQLESAFSARVARARFLSSIVKLQEKIEKALSSAAT